MCILSLNECAASPVRHSLSVIHIQKIDRCPFLYFLPCRFCGDGRDGIQAPTPANQRNKDLKIRQPQLCQRRLSRCSSSSTHDGDSCVCCLLHRPPPPTLTTPLPLNSNVIVRCQPRCWLLLRMWNILFLMYCTAAREYLFTPRFSRFIC